MRGQAEDDALGEALRCRDPLVLFTQLRLHFEALMAQYLGDKIAPGETGAPRGEEEEGSALPSIGPHASKTQPEGPARDPVRRATVAPTHSQGDAALAAWGAAAEKRHSTERRGSTVRRGSAAVVRGGLSKSQIFFQ